MSWSVYVLDIGTVFWATDVEKCKPGGQIAFLEDSKERRESGEGSHFLPRLE
jgi:hypothetical protein